MLATPYAAKVREIKAGGVFKTIAEKAVETDMRDPNQGKRHKNIGWQEQPGDREQRWDGQGMRSVVDDRAGTGATEVAEEAEIRR